MENFKPKQEKETPEAKGENEGMSSTAVACATCGKPLAEWTENQGKGVRREKVLYCSQACANKESGTGLYATTIGSGNP